jgi:norsolorinic acid ketoreductase
LAEEILSRPNHTLFAGVRDLKSDSALSLLAHPVAKGSSVHLVKIENASDTDAQEAIEKIKTAGTDHLDLVIANAGRVPTYARVEAVDINEMRQQYETNTFGTVKLLKAVYPLLKKTADVKGPGSPKFVGITSNAASIQDLEENVPFLLASYGSSKAALNYLVRRTHCETEWLTAFVVNPGFAQTDMGNSGAKYFGFESAFVTVKDSIDGIFKHVSLRLF